MKIRLNESTQVWVNNYKVHLTVKSIQILEIEIEIYYKTLGTSVIYSPYPFMLKILDQICYL